MTITTKTVRVTQEVEVTLDESKFTPEFMEEYRTHHNSFDTLDEHRCHLAQLFARGIYDDDAFIEGYGPAKDMGIRFRAVYDAQEEDVL